MKKIIQLRKKSAILGIFFISVSGSIFFFPISISDRYTCFYHRLFDHPDQVTDNANTTSSRDNVKGESKSPDDHTGVDRMHERDNERKKQNNREKSYRQELNSLNGSILLDKYLHKYAFPWWFSVALTALSIFLWKRLKRDHKKNQSYLNSFIV